MVSLIIVASRAYAHARKMARVVCVFEFLTSNQLEGVSKGQMAGIFVSSLKVPQYTPSLLIEAVITHQTFLNSGRTY